MSERDPNTSHLMFGFSNDTTFLSTDEVAKYMRMSKRTLEKMRLEKRGPPYFRATGRGRSRVFYPQHLLEQWLEEHTYLVFPHRSKK